MGYYSSGDGFARAQAQYDAMLPPEQEECPECDGEEYDKDVQDCPHGFYTLLEKPCD